MRPLWRKSRTKLKKMLPRFPKTIRFLSTIPRMILCWSERQETIQFWPKLPKMIPSWSKAQRIIQFCPKLSKVIPLKQKTQKMFRFWLKLSKIMSPLKKAQKIIRFWPKISMATKVCILSKFIIYTSSLTFLILIFLSGLEVLKTTIRNWPILRVTTQLLKTLSMTNPIWLFRRQFNQLWYEDLSIILII